MGKWSLKKGSVFDTDCEILAHGVNCKNAFGSGIAGQISMRYPAAKKAYHDKFLSEGWNLGEVQFVNIDCVLDSKTNYYMGEAYSKIKVIANMATQFTYGKTGKHVDYKAVENCLYNLFNFAKQKNYSVAMPWVGCGLAGGDKKEIKKIIENILGETKGYGQVKFPVNLEIWEL